MELRAVAQGLGVTYQQLTGDLSSVNFSSGKMGWMEHERAVESWRWTMLIPVMCGGVWDWFSQQAELFLGVNIEALNVGWTPPKRTMIDPTKEIPATRDAIRSGQMTLFEALRERGHDPREALSEYQEANALLDELGIVIDSDPRHTASSGNRVEDVQQEDSANAEN
jgi:capsid protein